MKSYKVNIKDCCEKQGATLFLNAPMEHLNTTDDVYSSDAFEHLHNIYGPAWICASGEQYYINGIQYDKEEWETLAKKMRHDEEYNNKVKELLTSED